RSGVMHVGGACRGRSSAIRPPEPSPVPAMFMAERQLFSSGAPWEPEVGYSRAVRVGSHVHVSGCTAIDEAGNVVDVNDPYRQTHQTLRNVERALRALGATFEDVVRTRIYVTDIGRW